MPGQHQWSESLTVAVFRQHRWLVSHVREKNACHGMDDQHKLESYVENVFDFDHFDSGKGRIVIGHCGNGAIIAAGMWINTNAVVSNGQRHTETF